MSDHADSEDNLQKRQMAERPKTESGSTGTTKNQRGKRGEVNKGVQQQSELRLQLFTTYSLHLDFPNENHNF